MNRRRKTTGSQEILQTPAGDLGALAVERGYCTPEQLAEAQRQAQSTGADLSTVLLESGSVTLQQVRALERAVRGATVIGGFEILEKVGQGGMGAVFRARQINMDRVVALKILPPHLAKDQAFKQRFLREARLSAKLNHLNIINGIDCGEAGGYTFFAMEFIDGYSVHKLLRDRKPIELEECYRIVRQIADALVYANKNGLVHRDIKPDNIMIAQGGIAKLCDLGLAKKEEGSEDASLTQSGQAVGTPHYIAPEQARGLPNVDTRADIYSLGATFYHMLTGRPPFDGNSSAVIMAKHLTEEAPSVCQLNPEVPETWGQVVSMMMAKAPEDRYANPEELIADLTAAHDDLPVEAARFRGVTSCARPKGGAKRRLSPNASNARSVLAIGSSRAPGSSGNLPRLNDSSTAQRAVRYSPGTRRGSSVPIGAILGGVVAIVGLLILMNLFDSAPPPSRPQARARPRTPDPAPDTAVRPGTDAPKPATPDSPATKAGVPDPSSPATPTNPATPVKDLAANPPVPASDDLALPGEKPEPKPAVPAPDPKTNAPPPKPGPAAPGVPSEPTARRAYAEFLKKMTGGVSANGLTKTRDALKKEIGKPANPAARSSIEAEFKELERLIGLEEKVLHALAEKKVTVRLTDEGADHAPADTGVAKEAGPGDQLMLTFRGGEGKVAAHWIDPRQIAEMIHARSGATNAARYLTLRGDLDAAGEFLARLSGGEREHLEANLALLKGPAPDKVASVTPAQPVQPAPSSQVQPKQGVGDVAFRDAGRNPSIGGMLADARIQFPTGIAVGDVNGDGRPDLLFGSDRDSGWRFLLGSAQGFQDGAPASALSSFPSRTAHIGDLNGDGRADLSFLASGRLHRYLNEGGDPLRFRTMIYPPEQEKPINNTEGSAWIDFDGDGRAEFLAAADPRLFLFKFPSDDRVDDVSEAAGLDTKDLRSGNGDFLIAVDLDNDSYTDVVYSGEAGRGLVLHNEQGRRFVKADNGIAYGGDHDHKTGLAWGDVNNDGWADVFVPHPKAPKLFINDGRGRFREALAQSGDLANLGEGSFAAAFADLDLDGDQDLLVADAINLHLYLNDGAGRFHDRTEQMRSGRRGNIETISSIGVLDADGNGLPDLVLLRGDHSNRLLLNQNNVSAQAAPLRVRFDTRGGRPVFGARVEVTDGWRRTQTQWVSGGDGRGSNASPDLIFGVPAGEAVVKVTFPGGKTLSAKANVTAPSGGAVTLQTAAAGSAAPVAVAVAPPTQPKPPDPKPPEPKAGEVKLTTVALGAAKNIGINQKMEFDAEKLTVTWLAKDAVNFGRDWQIDDPRKRGATERFVLAGAEARGALVRFKGTGGAFYGTGRNEACLVTLRNVKPARFRLEIAYEAGENARRNFLVGIGLWDGDKYAMGFGSRYTKEGDLGIWGYTERMPWMDSGVLDAQNKARGQLAIQADGKEWTFWHRDFEKSQPEDWRRIYRMKQEGDWVPALTPWTYNEGYLEMYIHAVRLQIMKDDPLYEQAKP
ncbi:MAG: FG-GAP-like repeat-containing protein [Planctomycetes bacterium]|nr:FG-GAP-like repeat-containing protein [Planctomycetota bacterium]